MRGLFLLWLTCIASAQPQPLKLGVPVEREIAQGEIHAYQVGLAAGQYLRISLDQRRLSLTAKLAFPDGKPAVAIDDTGLQEPPVPMPVVAAVPGIYSVELRLRERASPGPYRIEIVELRAAVAADDKRVAAETFFREGFDVVANDTRENRLAALAKFQRAQSLWREAGDRAGEGRALKKIGWVYFRLGESKHAIETYEQTVALARETGDRLFEAEMLNNLGLEYYRAGDYPKALADLETSMALMRELGKGRLSSPISNVGLVYLMMGNISKALQYYEQALELRRRDGDRPGEAATLTGIALAVEYQGQYQKALDTFQHAMDLWHASGDRQQEALALSNIAVVYLKLGDPQSALERLQRVLVLKRSVGDRSGEWAALSNIGGAYSEMGQQDKAVEFYTLALSAARDMGNKPRQATVLNGLGNTFVRMGRLREALDHYAEARSLAIDSGDREQHVRSVLGMSRTLLRQGQPDRALPLAEEGLSVARSGGLRDNEQPALVAAAEAEADLGNLSRARDRIDAAVQLAESVRGSVAGVDLRTSYFAGIRREYDLLIDILMRLHRAHPGAGYDAQAFAVSERARARSLIDLLGESRGNIREGIDAALLEREQSLRAALHVKSTAPDKDVQELILQYREVENQIRARSPRYAALTLPHPVSLDEIQKGVLGPDTMLLEYALGEKRSYLWTVTATGLSAYELPGREAIEAAARTAYSAISSAEPGSGGDALQALSSLVLGPVARTLGRKRLVIVSEGALQYVPFSALPDASGEPLIANHEIVGLPSGSTLAALRRELAGRRPARMSVIAFGDPVFSRTDPRVLRHTPAPPGEPGTALERSAKDSGLTGFDRLWATRREAESIAALGGPSGGRKLVDFDASRKTAINGELERYRIIHFATHGLLNNRHPEFSGLVLSLVDPDGTPVNGFLRAYEIYNLKLHADLVVLSACQTALGEDIRGEGLVGLTRGFMYAGAPRVVASLWKVPDLATAELMRRFYQGVLSEHRRPADALRAAQVVMRSEGRRNAPYYWAGFVLQGEWR